MSFSDIPAKNVLRCIHVPWRSAGVAMHEQQRCTLQVPVGQHEQAPAPFKCFLLPLLALQSNFRRKHAQYSTLNNYTCKKQQTVRPTLET